MPWFVYIIECENGSLYVGITEDLDSRFTRHRQGDGADHTGKFPPKRLIYREAHDSLESASVRERQLKGWSRAKKHALAAGRLRELRDLAKCPVARPVRSPQ
ncbi:MAG: GIY-YIG nuclease family protein [Verrucomicrobia bacterium]|nr:GIY-YIG nuclease family protein [Verrucomicrobiota bacterium]